MNKLLLSTALTLIICLTPGKIFSQLIKDSLQVGDHFRYFYFNTPTLDRYSALMFVLHGSGNTGPRMLTHTKKLEDIAEKDALLVVYPNGYKNYWNECRKAANSEANLIDVDEIAFFSGMIQYFKKKYRINDQHVFVAGTSGGGHMAYKLALLMPEKLKGITAIIANLPDDDNMDCIVRGKPVPIPVMIINGTEDPLNRYDGGLMVAGDFIMGNVMSTDRTFQYWVNNAGYKDNPVKQLVPDADPADGKTIERYTYRAPGKPEMVLLKVIGGKHDYPNDIDVHLESWEFFKRQITR